MVNAERAQVPTAWPIRAGRTGEREEFALEIGVSGGGWNTQQISRRYRAVTAWKRSSANWSPTGATTQWAST